MHFASALFVTGLMASTALAAPAHVRRFDDGMYHPSGDNGSYKPTGNDGSYKPSGNSGAYKPTGDDGSYKPTGDDGSYKPTGDDGSYKPSNYGTGMSGASTTSSGYMTMPPPITIPAASQPTYSASQPPFGSSTFGEAPSYTMGGPPMSTGTGGPLPSLNSTQSKNARLIIEAVQEEGMGHQGCVIAITCALQESELMNYANSARVPESMNYPHDIDGGDQDSIGLFQQKASIYQDIAADMDPKKATKQFLELVKKDPTWKTGEPNTVVQNVQKAEAGDRYAWRIPTAKQVCDASGIKRR